MIAIFFFHFSANQNQNKTIPGLGGNNKKPQYNSDEMLGFEAAVAALGLKANVSEADHPLLCEGTRRQVMALFFTTLFYYVFYTQPSLTSKQQNL